VAATALLLALQLASAPEIPAEWFAGCTAEEVRTLTACARALSSGEACPLQAAADSSPESSAAAGCLSVRLARSSLAGWTEARRLAASGGSVASLGAVTRRLDEIRAIKDASLALDVEFAEIVVRAAIAAAQDERPEMGLLLDHARDLAARLAEEGRRALWPRPYNLAAGELWLEVDRYEEARAAYERAASFDNGAAALLGLGRALEALGRHSEACLALRKIPASAGAIRDEARPLLAACP